MGLFTFFPNAGFILFLFNALLLPSLPLRISLRHRHRHRHRELFDLLPPAVNSGSPPATMASEVVAVGELPLLLPIKTALGGEKIAAAVGEGGGGEEEGGCVTPKSEQHVLKPPSVCPPAPRKPNPARRSASAKPNCKEFFVVPRDLTSIFIPIPPKKRIRVI